jgi:hypothetical protein
MPVKTKKPSKQASIAGTESPSIPELDTACRAYVPVRNQRMELTVKEKSLKNTVLGIMKDHNLTEYFRRDDGVYVVLTNDVKVRVR